MGFSYGTIRSKAMMVKATEQFIHCVGLCTVPNLTEEEYRSLLEGKETEIENEEAAAYLNEHGFNELYNKEKGE
jgi:hypothetical protein